MRIIGRVLEATAETNTGGKGITFNVSIKVELKPKRRTLDQAEETRAEIQRELLGRDVYITGPVGEGSWREPSG